MKRSAGNDEEFRLERFLPYRLSVLANRLSRAFARRYQDEFGISIAEWRVVAVLGAFAPLSSNEIGERTEMDKAKVSRAVAALLKAGMIAREAHPTDQRLIQLALSRQGRKIYEAIVPRAGAGGGDDQGAVAPRSGADPCLAGSARRAHRRRRRRGKLSASKKPRPQGRGFRRLCSLGSLV